MGREHGRQKARLLSSRSSITGALLLSLTGTVSPAAAQTMLDRFVQRIAKPKSVASAIVPEAATSVPGTNTSDFRLDIAGVRLGMTPDDAKAALVATGYHPIGRDWLTYGPSYASQVRQEAERRRTGSSVTASMADRVVTRIEAAGPGRAGVVVHLEPVPTGSSVVTAVDFGMPADVITGPALLRQATAKYGMPDGQGDGGLTAAWCPAAVKAVCGSISSYPVDYRSLPSLRASTVLSARRLWLSEGMERGRRREREFAAAVDAAAPRSDHAAF